MSTSIKNKILQKVFPPRRMIRDSILIKRTLLQEFCTWCKVNSFEVKEWEKNRVCPRCWFFFTQLRNKIWYVFQFRSLSSFHLSVFDSNLKILTNIYNYGNIDANQGRRHKGGQGGHGHSTFSQGKDFCVIFAHLEAQNFKIFPNHGGFFLHY